MKFFALTSILLASASASDSDRKYVVYDKLPQKSEAHCPVPGQFSALTFFNFVLAASNAAVNLINNLNSNDNDNNSNNNDDVNLSNNNNNGNNLNQIMFLPAPGRRKRCAEQMDLPVVLAIELWMKLWREDRDECRMKLICNVNDQSRRSGPAAAVLFKVLSKGAVLLLAKESKNEQYEQAIRLGQRGTCTEPFHACTNDVHVRL